LIGAHAVIRDYAILTRDAKGYRSYFPTVELITPETHP
jgi:predicted nucleic acid-binding protein